MQAVMQSKLAEDIDKYFDAVTENKEELIVNRENGPSVVVMGLDEYNSLLEDKITKAKKNEDAISESSKEIQVSVKNSSLWQYLAKEANQEISIESVREALSSIKGSLAQDIIAEREDRI